MDEDDVFEDTISVTSEGPRGKELISLSRFTIYHSAQDLQQNDDEEEDKLHTGEESFLVEKQEDLDNISVTKGPNMFSDGTRTVDFVLVWTEENEKASPTSVAITRQKRSSFERNLEDEGLVLEHEHVKNVHFVKLHATHEVLCRYSEILKLRLPMKEIPGETIEAEPASGIMDSLLWRFLNFVHVDTEIFKPIELKFTAEFSRDKTYLFDVSSKDFFSPSIRVTVVDYILDRNKFESPNKKDPFSFGVSRLINEGVYKAAYPLHDGDYRQPGCMRNLLFYEWASVIKWIKFQPVDHIKEYFGVKFGLYFAWLGFYTHMLILASVVGLICFFYGLTTMFSDNLSNDICNKDLNITMCPLCDKRCDYWQLHETCGYARISYLFDNPFTVFFAVFMSFWATLFLELWKRYSADVTHRWGLTGFDLQAEHPRPQYYARLKNANEKINVVTNLREPCVPFWKVRVPATLLSYSVMILLASVAVGAVFGVVLYRMSLLAGRILFTDTYGVMSSVTAAVINLVFIMILNWFYDWLAVHLTELEVLRTQTEFDNSLTLKIYLFQFVNYYTSIFYIAFLKGKFVGYPAKYNRILGLRQEECAPGGCLMELCIQLAIIMVGKQALNSILEMVIPFVYKWINTLRVKAGVGKEEEKAVSCTQWAKDYTLLDWGPRGLFPEYLEMVLQYGFVTIFVAAFPLAPVFALINNVLEMRLDAKKFLKFYRRPVPSRVKNIGVWFRIMDVIARMSVVTNAFIIAFSSNFIPRLVYIMTVNKNHTDVGYLEHSLAYFNTSDFDVKAAPLNPSYNVSVCRYAEYRYNHTMPPDLKYKRPPIYWHILAARLAFVVVFQNVVGMVMTAVQWCIPDMSRKLRDDIRREAYLTNEMIIKQEMVRARGHLNRPPDSEQFIEHEKVPEANGSKGDNVRHRRDPEKNSPEDFV